MLNQKAKDYLKSLGVTDFAKFETAFKDANEVEFVFDKPKAEDIKAIGLTAKDLGWHTPEELDIAKSNTKKGAEEAVLEITAKAFKDEYGIKIDSKDLKEVVKEIAKAEGAKAVTAAGVSVDEQIKERDKTIDELRGNIVKVQGEFATTQTEAQKWKGELDTVRENEEFARFLPNDYNPLLRPQDYRQRFLEEENIGFKKINGAWMATDAEGNLLKDTLVNPIPAKAKIDEVFAKRADWKKPQQAAAEGGQGGLGTGNSGGNGGQGSGGNGKGSTYKSVSELHAAKVAGKWDNRKYQEEYNKAAAQEGFDPMA